MRSERYQIALIALGLVVTALFGYFFYKEIFPEYRIYQDDYAALEEFRSSYTGEPPPQFKEGVKQIVFEREDKGPARIDRCISCHVALELPHFSPTQIAHDSNGHLLKDKNGTPVQEPNPNYIWNKLDKKIAELKDEKVNEQLNKEGKGSAVKSRLKEAEGYEALKTAQVGHQTFDVKKALAMHPLIGKETRPFEFHPIEEYGCTSCHSGNGRGLTTDTAHGPVFDGQYEIEYMGPFPSFTEHDAVNDPEFAHVFNHKPDDSLLFQTSPILVGNLIQSSCVQCHKQNRVADPELQAALNSDIDKLTKHFQRGEQLFFSQACYACHRISALSRGGVGPELTREGDAYPWYIKNKLMWPQFDLKTSTMPNMVLDPTEVEDIMTFLLAQKGPSKAVSEIDYKVAVQQWEGGRKLNFEKPVPPSKIKDLRYSMTVFASEGCAACHRLEGFESNVGYRIEKDAKPAFNALYKEKEWFQSLFHEEMRGSAITTAIEKHAKEIDEHIVDDARKDSLLEEIEASHPDLLESFYANFRYAARAKDNQFKGSEDQLVAWKKRVHNVLMIYIQEYGLGRLIGPRPNWSGVYRSDEWLMEHFHNPAGHVTRSIMPIFPFDESKFAALTYMLDVLGKRNRDAVREIWKDDGFDPEIAFHIHCSQCHGDFLQGNGPVATWIYPIPKNLRNAEFLRNLTKANAIESITHGVKGTPMPPWGETPKDKQTYDGIPVLTSQEIQKIADWLYSSIPGGSVIRGPQDVPKWNYMPKDVLEELQREGSKLVPGKKEKPPESGSLQNKTKVPVGSVDKGLPELLAALPKGDHYYAAVEPKVYVDVKEDEVTEVFDVKPYPVPGEDKKGYYIKKEYYTPENLAKGKKFFDINCAVCHGFDADGTGARSSVMVDAKPRMLTNFDWIQTRDDLRLLRSIKFGVPGTAMTPWGDFTSSLQRLQLVMYIRSLSEDKGMRETLLEELYHAFEPSYKAIDEARIAGYSMVASLQDQFDETQKNQIAAYQKSQSESDDAKEAVELYQKQIDLGQKLKKAQEVDFVLVELKSLIAKEQDVYQGIGNDLLSANLDGQLWAIFMKMIRTNKDGFNFADGKLSMKGERGSKELKDLAKQMIEIIDAEIKQLDAEKIALNGKLPSVDKDKQLEVVSGKLSTYNKIKARISKGMESILDLRKQEMTLL